MGIIGETPVVVSGRGTAKKNEERTGVEGEEEKEGIMRKEKKPEGWE